MAFKRSLNLPGLFRDLPGQARRFGVEFITVNPALKISSLLLATLMWSFVAAQRGGESSEIQFTTPLVLKNIPLEMEVTDAPVQSVSVLLRASRVLANAINPSQFQVSIDLANQFPGSIEYTLTEQDISYNSHSVPNGMIVLQISPARVPISLEESVSVTLPVKPRFVGNLSKGFILGTITNEPSVVEVRGPRSIIESMTGAPTRPLDVQDLNSNVDLLATLDLPPRVRLAGEQELAIHTNITVSSNPERVLLRNIAVRFINPSKVFQTSTRTLNVHLEGPREVVEQLSQDNLFAQVDLRKYPPGDYRGITPPLVLPDTVKVLEQWPILDLFVINRDLEPKN